MKHKLFVILFIIMLTALLTGCWDRKDIENRGYVLGIAIDVYTPDSQEKQSGQEDSSESSTKNRLEGMETHTGEHQYVLTVQLPILAKSSTTAQGGSGGGDGDGKKTVEITQVGNSFMSMQREMQSRTSLSLYYEHLQVIVISEDAARQGLEDIIDFFVRDPEMRRRVKIFVSKGEAKSVKEVHSMCQQTINKMQLEYGADVFQFKKILKSKEPAYWKNISHQWDLIYPHAEVNINVDVSLQLIGIVQ
jgi:Ger(x)C family germination protein